MKYFYSIVYAVRCGFLWRALLVAAVSLTAVPVSAQWRVGASMGYAHNTLSIDEGYAYGRNYLSRGGFAASVPGQYDFCDWFGLRAELSYMEKGYEVERTGEYSALYGKVSNRYLQLPVMADFSFGGRRLRGFLNLGGYVGCWLSSNVQGTSLRYFDPEGLPIVFYRNANVALDPRRDNRFEAGLIGGIGLSYRASARVVLEAEWRIYYSLTDMQKDYMYFHTPRYNTTMAFQIGCMFLLGSNK